MADRLKTWALMALVIVLAALVYFGVHAHLDDQCQRKGGHLVAADRSWLCVTTDGRVIE